MKKKYDIIFSAVKLPLDFLIVLGSFFIARKIRIGTDSFLWIDIPYQTIDSNSLLYYAIFWSFLFVWIFAIHWLYSIKITSSKIKEFFQIILYSFYWVVLFSFFVYIWIDIIIKTSIPRLVILFSFLISTILVISERVLLNYFENFLLNKWVLEKKKLLIVTNRSIKKIDEIIKDIKEAKIYQIIWYSNKEKLDLWKYNYLWWIENLKDLFENKEVDELLYIDSDYNKKELHDLWELTRIFWVRYRYMTNSFDVTKTNTTLSLINNIPVIEIKNTSLDNWAKIWKRLFDFIVWIIWVIILSPLFLIIAIAIKLEDPKWPIIYKNIRIWKAWKKFNLYKFRYMKWEYCIKEAYNIDDNALDYEKELIEKNSTRNWPLYKIKNDPRKTRIWNFIEKYSIDELPQFFNLIIWNMSLVWPRPHQPREVEKYTIEQKRLLTIKPWITGMAQVNWREKNDFKKEAELDIFYIENWNALLDLKIILKTFSVILNRK